MSPTRSLAQIEGFRSDFINVGDLRLHYWIGGEPTGRPVILWHGFLGTGYVWRHVGPALATAGMAVLIPDMRGYGDSDKPDGTVGYDGRALAEECRALVAAIGFGLGQPIILAAHDMGAPPALLWTASYPAEISGLLYVEEPVMLAQVMQQLITYTSEAEKTGSLWWWLLSLAPGAPEALVVGNERNFLLWFYRNYVVVDNALPPETVDEYLRTFTGHNGVLSAMGVYRAAFKTIAQTEQLTNDKVKTPVVALGGEKSLGAHMGTMVRLVAENVAAYVIEGCGHFIPEERPEVVVKHILALATGGNIEDGGSR